MITYCRRCIMPTTRPGTILDDGGICGACRSYEDRKEVDWEGRRSELLTILDRYRSKDGSNYDCIVPVSGGKDSHFQTITLLELGMNPLCVTATTDMLTDIGRRNIENLKNLGVDYIEVTVNPKVRRKISRRSLLEWGDNIAAEHATIFTIPARIAVKFGVPLLVWGENSQNEDGGAPELAGAVLTKEYFRDAVHGFNPSDLVGKDGIRACDLIQYTYPTEEELEKVGATGIHLGYYVPWNGRTNALVAQAHGFNTFPTAIEGSMVNYENVDNAYTGVHDYLMFLKFGFGRATHMACFHIRRGLYSRKQGIEAARRLEGRFPWTYLGVPVERVLDDLDMTLEEFKQVCDRFTNKELFVCDEKGDLLRDRKGNLTKINYDNPDT